MRFENFEIVGGEGVELASAGRNWDLHNFVDFTGFCFDAQNRELQLSWLAPESVENPWGDLNNDARACSLCFQGVTYLQVAPRKASLPFTEDLTLELIAKVRPGQSSVNGYALAATNEEFALFLQFHSEAWIEIIADCASLVSEYRD